MKRYLLVLLTLFTVNLNAQKGINIGVAAGVTNYFGDLGNNEFLQATSIRPGIAITARNLISPPEVTGMQYSVFDVEARISWHRIGYEETNPIGDMKGFKLQNYGRGLGFRTDLLGFESHLTYTYYPNRRLPLSKQSMAFFAFGGVGVYYGRPKADLFRGDIDINNRYYFWSDGTTRDGPEASGKGNVIKKDGKYETDLMEWYTEGQGSQDETHPTGKMYSPWKIGFPMGFGFRYGLNKKITLSAEVGYYKFITDYLDDVSDGYATYKQIQKRFPNDPVKQALAEYISDPTGLGTTGAVGPATSRRGNPAISDSYSFFNLEVSYRIDWTTKRLTALLFN